MPTTQAIIFEMDEAEFKRVSGLAKFNATRTYANRVKQVAVLPGYCPVQTGYLRSQHSVEYLGGSMHAVLADTRYAEAVHEGAQGRIPNRWLLRAIDTVKAASGNVT